MLELKNLIDLQATNQRMIIVTGAYRAGKSRFIQSLVGDTPTVVDVSSYFDGEVVPLNLSILKLGYNQHLFVLECPGAVYIQELLSSNFVLGIIVLVSSAKPETFTEARSIYAIYKSRVSIPVLPVVNPQETVEWSENDFRLIFRLSEQEQLFWCDITLTESAHKLMLHLISQMPNINFVHQLQSAWGSP